MDYELLASAFYHPNSQEPYRGLFNKRSLEALADHPDCSVSVSSPIPYAPPIGPYSYYRRIPKSETFDGYEVARPRFPYFVPKSLFHALTGKFFQHTTKRIMSDLSGDIFHGCHIFPDGYGLVSISKQKQTPLTVTAHGHFLNNLSSLPPGVRRQVRKTLVNASHVFCVSDALKSIATKIAPSTTVSTVPIGASPENYPTSSKDKLREFHSIPSDTTIVLFCGQFIERKGVNDIIESFDRFPNDSVEYVFVGHGGELKNKLKNTAKSENTPDSIRIKMGLETSELREWYAMADLLLLPSYAEGRPTVIYEAMAAETAVLSTHIDGITEQVQDGETGMLIEPGNQESLVESLQLLAQDRSNLYEMGKNGLKRLVSKRWTWEGHAERIVNIHSNLICVNS